MRKLEAKCRSLGQNRLSEQTIQNETILHRGSILKLFKILSRGKHDLVPEFPNVEVSNVSCLTLFDTLKFIHGKFWVTLSKIGFNMQSSKSSDLNIQGLGRSYF